jgi:hypothetical protein
MEAKDKARELVGRFDNVVHSNAGSNNFDFESAAKECALICVDEILKSLEHNTWQNLNTIILYNEVKQEINKL